MSRDLWVSTQLCMYLEAREAIAVVVVEADQYIQGRERAGGRQVVLRETVAEADRREGTAPSYMMPKIRQTEVEQGNIRSCLPSSRHITSASYATVSKDLVCQRIGRQ